MKESVGLVAVWAGTVGTEDELFDHVEMDYVDDGHHPHERSEFMRVFRTGFYDEDFAEGAVVETGSTFAELLAGLSYGESFGARVLAGLGDPGELNAVYTIFDWDASGSVALGHSPLRFLGAFPYHRTR